MRHSGRPGLGRWGFTLIELMITVGIIGLLAAIAVPGLLRFQLRAKSTEATMNLRAIAKAEGSYFAEHGLYASAPVPSPLAIPGNHEAAWPADSDFDTLGWRPEGSVLFSYRVAADGGGGSLNVPGPCDAASGIDVF